MDRLETVAFEKYNSGILRCYYTSNDMINGENSMVSSVFENVQNKRNISPGNCWGFLKQNKACSIKTVGLIIIF